MASPALPPRFLVPAAGGESVGNLVYGANRDLTGQIDTHLFCIAPNNSGSTFLSQALATCRAAWSLPDEGQKVPGYVGPVTTRGAALAVWAAERRTMQLFADPQRHDWPRTRKAWYFFAQARTAQASVLVVKSAQQVLQVEQLARHFHNAKFLFMVRNPYAVCEGICRNHRRRFGRQAQPPKAGRSLEARAAAHVLNCLRRQRRNIEAFGDRGAFFTYEAMCGAPERTAQRIRALAPELADLNLRQRLPVKGRYFEMLRDMNPKQIARLTDEQVAAFNQEFQRHQEVLDYFGYSCAPSGSG